MTNRRRRQNTSPRQATYLVNILILLISYPADEYNMHGRVPTPLFPAVYRRLAARTFVSLPDRSDISVGVSVEVTVEFTVSSLEQF